MAEQFCLPLTILFTQSFKESTLPGGWKGGHVIPVHKEGDCNLVKQPPNDFDFCC